MIAVIMLIVVYIFARQPYCESSATPGQTYFNCLFVCCQLKYDHKNIFGTIRNTFTDFIFVYYLIGNQSEIRLVNLFWPNSTTLLIEQDQSNLTNVMMTSLQHG